ncbi:MAG: hypothetical protein ACLGG7_02665 [Bacteriovoracia bacterium]
MLARKLSSQQGEVLPLEWSDTVGQLLNQTYAQECTAQARTFAVYGQIFEDELLVIIGFNPLEATAAATTCFLSCDKADISTPEKVKATQTDFVDIAGMFFDEIFATEDWSDWEPNWQEVEWKGKTFFYKLTRENVTLTLEADRMLRQAGFDPEDTE